MYGELPEISLLNGDNIRAFPVVIRNPLKTASLRLPTSAELLSYLSHHRSIHRSLGRGIGESESVPNPKTMDFFKTLRLDDGLEFDEFEATKAIDLLTYHRVVSCERSGEEYTITLSTSLGDVSHTVIIPWEKDQAEYRRTMFKSRDLPHGMEERRFPPEAGVKLYDKIVTDVGGYLDLCGGAPIEAVRVAVPPHHKISVILDLMSALDALDSVPDPN